MVKATESALSGVREGGDWAFWSPETRHSGGESTYLVVWDACRGIFAFSCVHWNSGKDVEAVSEVRLRVLSITLLAFLTAVCEVTSHLIGHATRYARSPITDSDEGYNRHECKSKKGYIDMKSKF
jgi:hypothetical protein